MFGADRWTGTWTTEVAERQTSLSYDGKEESQLDATLTVH
jgi:hypothetical protein